MTHPFFLAEQDAAAAKQRRRIRRIGISIAAFSGGYLAIAKFVDFCNHVRDRGFSTLDATAFFVFLVAGIAVIFA